MGVAGDSCGLMSAFVTFPPRVVEALAHLHSSLQTTGPQDRSLGLSACPPGPRGLAPRSPSRCLSCQSFPAPGMLTTAVTGVPEDPCLHAPEDPQVNPHPHSLANFHSLSDHASPAGWLPSAP